MADVTTMDSLTREDLRSLAETRFDDNPGAVVSIFHPTDRVAPRPEQNSLRLKNALAAAEAKLAAAGFRKPEIDRILKPARNLLDNSDFWHHQLDGLATFCAKGFFRYFRLPFPVGEIVHVGDSLLIKPLLPGLVEGSFYVLQISQKQLRLFRGNRYRMDEVDISDLDIPHNLDEALRYDDLQKPETQHHVGTGPGRDVGSRREFGRGDSARQERTFHGHGEEGDEQKAQIQHYFRLVDAGISKLLEAERAPLLPAAVDYLHPLYAEVSNYGCLIEGITGNHDHASAAELHAAAWQKVEPRLREGVFRSMERYRRMEGTGLASCDLWDVAQAAYSGRVDTLFLREGDEVWGLVDLNEQKMETRDEPAEGDTELLDLMSRQVITHAGDVYVLSREDMPCDSPAGAVYRY